MRLKIEICLDNAAFEEDPAAEVNHIIQHQVIPMLWHEEVYLRLFDSNGNSVGTAKVVED